MPGLKKEVMPLLFSGGASALRTSYPLACNAGTSQARFRNSSAANGLHSDFENQFHAGHQPDEPKQVMSSGLVTGGAAAKHDLLLRHELRRAHVVPAVNRRCQLFL